MTVAAPDGTLIGWDEAGAGRPLLLVHGGVGDLSAWNLVRSSLSRRDVRVVAIDRRGRGRSDRADEVPHSLRIEAADVVAVAQELGGDVVVAAHSIGATITLEALRSRPDLFSAAVLYEPPLPGMPSGLGSSQRMLDALADDRQEDALDAFLRDMVQLDDVEIEAYRKSPLWSRRVALVWTMLRESAALRSLDPDPQRWAGIEVPVLLVVGDRTAPPLRQAIETLAGALPRADVRVLAGHGHGALVSGPDLIAAAVVDVLGDAAATR